MVNRQSEESPRITKDSIRITSKRYQTPKTIPLIFRFDPYSFLSPKSRLHDCTIGHNAIEGSDIYQFDDFFTENEAEELRSFSKQAVFSRQIFAEKSSKAMGEEPAKAMNNKEKWKFFSNPPLAIKELFKLLNFWAHQLDVEITTLPWELYDDHECAPAFATNYLRSLSAQSEELGKHDDYNTDKGISFAIPVLYSNEEAFHPSTFINGAPGMPWLVTIMVYATSEDFLPEYGLGSIFCKKNGEVALRTTCAHMRFIFFEGSIIHGVAASSILSEKNPWRVSYVFKLIFNPRRKDDSVKNRFLWTQKLIRLQPGKRPTPRP